MLDICPPRFAGAGISPAKTFELEREFWPFFLADALERAPGDLIFVAKEGAEDVFSALISNPEIFKFSVFFFKPIGVNLYDFITPNVDVVRDRMQVLYHLKKDVRKKLVITTSAAAATKIIPSCAFEIFSVKRGENFKMTELTGLFLEMGYKNANIVNDPGEFALRGGILDIFPANSSYPARMEFFGDEIDDLRFFSPETQRTIEEVCAIDIATASEVPLNSSTLAHFSRRVKNTRSEILEKIKQGIPVPEQYHFLPFFYEKLDSIFDYLNSPSVVFEQGAAHTLAECRANVEKFFVSRAETFNLLPPVDDFLIKNFDFPDACFLTTCNYDPKAEVVVLKGPDGVVLKNFSSVVPQKIKKSKRRAAKKINSFFNVEVGDYLIHESFGVGKYLGCNILDINGIKHDFISIEYANNDKLHVPVENLELVSKYSDSDTHPPLDKLGGTSWQLRKAKIKNRITEVADSLLKLSAERALKKSDFSILLDDGYEAFCKNFPYVETDDQLNAISDVVHDLASGHLMDRLVCGDVGFGKTEVALRAAYLVAAAGCQVAFVCPTTILCDQHREVFLKRFKDAPLVVESLSRMTSRRAALRIKEEVAAHKVDILIGTHSMFSKSLNFENLGLLIIDEEQHFGVKQKEQLKEAYPGTHVLTLSATPIPRTFQFALNNIKTMSLISEPPFSRKPIKTFTMNFDDVVIKEALMAEMRRGGGAFVVAPRVEDLGKLFERVARLVPDAKIALLHGKMPPEQIYATMHAFMSGQFDILISTNIIESGIDIPGANTIVVYRADMFGVSQLYQLRGRVGRSDIQSFAYFCVDDYNKISEPAKKRLGVLKAIDKIGYGSFSLAMSDLDIRGAGNALGEEQSGNIKEVGFALYQKMLRQAIELIKNSHVKHFDIQVTLNLGIPVFIPSDYISDLSLRLFMYKRISDLDSPAQIEDMKDELDDRFGKVPPELLNLLSLVKIKIECKNLGVERIDAGIKGITLTINKNAAVNLGNLTAFLTKFKGRITAENKFFIKVACEDKNVISNVTNLLKHLRKNSILQ